MTVPMRKTWLLLVVACGLAFIYRCCWSGTDRAAERTGPEFSLTEARRLLRAAPRILAEEQASAGQLLRIKKRFFEPGRLPKTRLKLLRLVEDLADQSGLSVQIKNTVTYSQTELGVSLEGAAPPEVIVGFLQRLTGAPLELRVKRMQLHSMPEQRALDYQIAISTLVVE